MGLRPMAPRPPTRAPNPADDSTSTQPPHVVVGIEERLLSLFGGSRQLLVPLAALLLAEGDCVEHFFGCDYGCCELV